MASQNMQPYLLQEISVFNKFGCVDSLHEPTVCTLCSGMSQHYSTQCTQFGCVDSLHEPTVCTLCSGMSQHYSTQCTQFSGPFGIKYFKHHDMYIKAYSPHEVFHIQNYLWPSVTIIYKILYCWHTHVIWM